jgi:hypothetical protein
MILLRETSDHTHSARTTRFLAQIGESYSRRETSWAVTLGQGHSLLASRTSRQHFSTRCPESLQPEHIGQLPTGFRAIAPGAFSLTLSRILAEHALFLESLETAEEGELSAERRTSVMEYICSKQMERIASCVSSASNLYEACVGLALMVIVLTIFHGYGLGRLWLQLRKDLATAVTAASRAATEELKPCILWCKAVAVASCTNAAGMDEIGLAIVVSFTQFEIGSMTSWPDFRRLLRSFLWPEKLDAYGKRAWCQATIRLKRLGLKD